MASPINVFDIDIDIECKAPKFLVMPLFTSSDHEKFSFCCNLYCESFSQDNAL